MSRKGRTFPLVACAVVAAVLWSVQGAAWAAVSVEQARANVEATTGVSLASAQVRQVPGPPDAPEYGAITFETTDAQGRFVRYEADAMTGAFVGFAITAAGVDTSEPGPVPSDNVALVAAQAAANQYLGAAAQGMQWQIGDRYDGCAFVEGRVPYGPDPERSGVTPECSVTVASNGEVTEYLQRPGESPPLEPQMTKEQALAAAAAQAGVASFTPAQDFGLYQVRFRLLWSGQATAPDGLSHSIRVDAVTGAVVEDSVAEEARLTPERKARMEIYRSYDRVVLTLAAVVVVETAALLAVAAMAVRARRGRR